MRNIFVQFRSFFLGLAVVAALTACSPGPQVPIPTNSSAASEATPASQETAAPVVTAVLAQDYKQVVEDFYTSYLTDTGGGYSTTPSDEAYRDSPILSAAMIEKADRLFASPPEEWNTDPFICAQIGPPELHAVSSFANDGRPVVVMSIPHPDYFFVVDMIASPENQWQIDDIHCNFSAEGVVNAFLLWALNLGLEGESLVDQLAYQDTGFLADSYRDELGRSLAGEGALTSNALLADMTRIASFSHQPCPQEGCTRIDVQYEDGTSRSFDVLWQDDEYHYEYKINGIIPSGQARAADELAAPPQASPIPQSVPEIEKSPARLVVEQFYGEYLGQYQAGQNPLREGSYKNSPYLFSGWAYEVEMLVAESPEDPLLCSAQIPDTLTVEGVVIEDGSAHVLAHTEPNDQYFTLEMTKEGEWQVMRVICPTSPEGIAWAFYTWYLGYAVGEQPVNASPELFRSAFADGAYRTSPFLAKNVIDWAEETKAATGADPFVAAQVFPISYWVNPGAGPEQATVRFQFGPMSAGYINLRVQEENGRWIITEIDPIEVPEFDPQAGREVDTSTWTAFLDEQNGFSFRYPSGWLKQELSLSPNENWEELVKRALLMPYETAVTIERQRQNPGSAAVPVVPPLQLEVFQADEDVFNKLHVTESLQRYQFNGHELRVEREFGAVRYVFRHPNRPDFWLVLIDFVSEMSGREEQAKDLAGVLMPLLHSVEIVP